jgi:hypothetical protein
MPKQSSILDSLSPEAQEKIIGWLEIDSARLVAERISQPAPEGFGLHTHVTTLRRFLLCSPSRRDPPGTVGKFSPRIAQMKPGRSAMLWSIL